MDLESRFKSVEETLEFLKEKLKSHDLSKNNIEQRLGVYDTKFGILAQQRVGRAQQNENQFDKSLVESSTFRQYLRKWDANSIKNLRKMEQHTNSSLELMHHKFGIVEDKLVNLITQKEKILEQISYQVQNHNTAIRGLEEWVKINQGQNRSLLLFEDNISTRCETLIREFDLKINTLQQQLNYAKTQREAFQQNTLSINAKIDSLLSTKPQSHLRHPQQNQFSTTIHSMNEKIDQLNHQITSLKNKNKKQPISDQHRTTRKVERRQQSAENSYEQILERLHYLQKSMDQEKVRNKTFKNASSRKQQDSEIQQLEHKIQNLTERIQALQESNMQSQRGNRKKTENFGYMNSINSKQDGLDQGFSLKRNQINRTDNLKRHNTRRNLDQQQKDNSQVNMSQMRSGIKGLLRKSKQRQDTSPIGRSRRQPSLLDPLKKPLPPKKNPLAPMRSAPMHVHDHRRQLYEQEQESAADIYQVDEEGYLLDSQGNYLTNEDGDRLQLSGEELQQILRQQTTQ